MFTIQTKAANENYFRYFKSATILEPCASTVKSSRSQAFVADVDRKVRVLHASAHLQANVAVQLPPSFGHFRCVPLPKHRLQADVERRPKPLSQRIHLNTVNTVLTARHYIIVCDCENVIIMNEIRCYVSGRLFLYI